MIRRLAPSVLNADLAQLADQVRLVEEAADWIHLDLMDGHFVPNLTFGPPVVAALRPHTGHYLDCHLMVADAEALLPALAEAGANGVTMHVEALDDPARAATAWTSGWPSSRARRWRRSCRSWTPSTWSCP